MTTVPKPPKPPKPPRERRGREYRVLTIAIVFFAVGLYFFVSDRPGVPPAAAPSAPAATAVQSGQALSPSLANYPPPSGFRTFTLGAASINGTSSFEVSAVCADAFVAVLVFPVSADYRVSPNHAVYNRAFPCAATGTVMTTVITPSDLGNAPSGTYYYFTADQGVTGVWYNPR